MSNQDKPDKNDETFLFSLALSTGHLDGFDEPMRGRVLKIIRLIQKGSARERKSEKQRASRAKGAV